MKELFKIGQFKKIYTSLEKRDFACPVMILGGSLELVLM